VWSAYRDILLPHVPHPTPVISILIDALAHYATDIGPIRGFPYIYGVTTVFAAVRAGRPVNDPTAHIRASVPYTDDTEARAMIVDAITGFEADIIKHIRTATA
jgi:hypothetical protein